MQHCDRHAKSRDQKYKVAAGAHETVVVTLRIPLPPPPSEAFIITGNPMRLHSSAACAAVVTLASA